MRVIFHNLCGTHRPDVPYSLDLGTQFPGLHRFGLGTCGETTLQKQIFLKQPIFGTNGASLGNV